MTTKKQGEIYLITNRVNNKKYVGQAVCITEKGRIAGAEKRFKTHLNKALKNIESIFLHLFSFQTPIIIS